MRFFKSRKKFTAPLDPDDIFVDSENLPRFDHYQMEGQLERQISPTSLLVLVCIFALVGFGFAYRVYSLQIEQGSKLAAQSENNRLNHTYLFADRGVIADRNGIPLAWNVPHDGERDFSLRQYTERPGFFHVLGYVKYPKKDKNGFYYNTSFEGFGGVEKFENEALQGKHGLKIVETNAVGDILSSNTIRPPQTPESLRTSIDANLQEAMFNSIKDIADEFGFTGGAGLLMDTRTGELLVKTSYPEFSSQIMTDGIDGDAISAAFQDERALFLDRPVSGLYTPGSIVKPFMALAALNEKVIDPLTNIISRGFISVPNPYNPDAPTRFNDWKAHGAVDARRALAVSSNVYFYVVGGGFEDIKGLGITKINEYIRKFGFGSPLKNPIFGDAKGTVPNPEWKKSVFPDDPWRLGDTYYTSIGQYGFQVTPMQVLRALSGIATKGTLVEPHLTAGKTFDTEKVSGIDPYWYTVVHEGMRLGAQEGSAKALNVDYMKFAAKTGTAELGVSKARVNSWVIGFYPYDTPRYAFVVMMESGSRSNLVGASAVSRKFFDWMLYNAPEYLDAENLDPTSVTPEEPLGPEDLEQETPADLSPVSSSTQTQ